MRLNAAWCLGLIASSQACRPMGDLDATRRGSSSVGGSSDAVNSESSTSSTPPVEPPSGVTTSGMGSTGVGPSPVSSPATTSLVTSSAVPSTSDVEDTDPRTESTAHADVPSTLATEAASSDPTSEPESTAQSASTASSETSEPETACTSKCGMGAACEQLTDCLSLRCDGVCQPMELVVESDGLDAISTSIKMHVELYGDPAVTVAWQDLAVLYFVTVETHNDFKLNFAQGGGTTMPTRVTLQDWILVWTTDAAGNVPATVTPFDVQIHSYPWLPDVPESNDNSNDHSYRAEPGPNDNIVLCRRVDGQWRHAQGTPPANIPDPCRYVGNCDLALECDPLEASPP